MSDIPSPERPGKRSWFGRLPVLGKIGLIGGVALLLLCACFSGLAVYGANLPKTASATATPGQVAVQTGRTPTARPSPTTRQPTATPTPKASPTATATPRPIYPPTSAADLHALAAKGDASAIHEFHSEGVGLPSCPQPKREVTVDPSITGQQLIEDLLAYFYANGLDSPCGSLVLAYHSQAEANDVYTAGRILVDTQNMDPNNTKAQRTMTLDSGGIGDPSAQEYMVTY